MYEIQIARGIAWLRAQGKEPITFDLDRLDLASGVDCPLGQAFGRVQDAPVPPLFIQVGGQNPDVEHGFDLPCSERNRGSRRADRLYAALTAEWRAAILAERTARRG